MVNFQKCAIIGCGFVGSTTAFSLIKNGVFSEIVLIDTNKEKAQGEAMDLNHSIPFLKPSNIYAGSYDDLSDCYLVIIAAGANQKPGESRIDLVNKNAKILKNIIPKITKINDKCILLILSNPVDILTYITLKISGLPQNQVIGSGTVLDTARLKYLLGKSLNVDSRNVHAFIIGEHGDSELAVWSSANISGVDLREFCKLRKIIDSNVLMNDLYQEVRTSAYNIIAKKGATYYAVATAASRIVESIVRNEHSVLTVSSYINNHYGLSDICMGVPTIIGKNGIESVIDIPLNEDEQRKLTNSSLTLREILMQIDI